MEFIVATGIECSAPKIRGGIRRDQLLMSDHWRRYEEDFDLVAALGITHLRYGVPFHVVARDPTAFDWTWTDLALEALRSGASNRSRTSCISRSRTGSTVRRSGVAGVVPGVRGGVRGSISMDPLVYPGQRAVHHRAVLGQEGLVERARRTNRASSERSTTSSRARSKGCASSVNGGRTRSSCRATPANRSPAADPGSEAPRGFFTERAYLGFDLTSGGRSVRRCAVVPAGRDDT